MAGNYPDAPSFRMPLDKDGTVFLSIDNAGVTTQLSSVEVAALADESEATPFTVSGILTGKIHYLGCVFPEARDVDGVFASIGLTTSPVMKQLMEISTNTTNLSDGVWTSVGAEAVVAPGTVKPDYRTNIKSTTALAVRGVRFRFTGMSSTSGTLVVAALHIYGEASPGENPNRLEMWHPTLDQKLAPAALDWGNVPRSSSADRQFRVKNLSTALTATAPRVAFDVLTDASPSVPAQHTLSAGGAFLAQVTLGDLAPGAVSPLVTIRRVTPSNAAFGLWSARVFAESTVWS